MVIYLKCPLHSICFYSVTHPFNTQTTQKKWVFLTYNILFSLLSRFNYMLIFKIINNNTDKKIMSYHPVLPASGLWCSWPRTPAVLAPPLASVETADWTTASYPCSSCCRTQPEMYKHGNNFYSDVVLNLCQTFSKLFTAGSHKQTPAELAIYQITVFDSLHFLLHCTMYVFIITTYFKSRLWVNSVMFIYILKIIQLLTYMHNASKII